MKAALVLCCLALFAAMLAAEYVCDNDSNNMPDCTNTTNHGVMIRNFYDPTRYWLCNSTSAAVSVPCEERLSNGTIIPKGFLVQTRQCVEWPQWTWSPNCPSLY